MKQKIWFITGISTGLGKALAQTVMNKGDFVIGTFRKQSQVDEFNQQNNGRGTSLLLDVTQPTHIEQAVSFVKTQHGQIDVLVNNAGVGFVGAIEETNSEEIRRVFEINFFGALAVTQAFLPLFRAQKRGHIIQISSHSGFKGFAGFGIYGASKFALEGASEALAQEVAPLGIQVTIVEPGPFRTEFAGDNLGQAQQAIDDYQQTAGAFKARIKGIHGKQEGDPEKAAQAILNKVYSEDTSLRLPLGKIAVNTLSAKIESVQHDLNQMRAVAEGTVF